MRSCCNVLGGLPALTVENEVSGPGDVVRVERQLMAKEPFQFVAVSSWFVFFSRCGPIYQIDVCLAELTDLMAAFYMLPRCKFDFGFSTMTRAAYPRFRAALTVLLASAARPAEWVLEGSGNMSGHVSGFFKHKVRPA